MVSEIGGNIVAFDQHSEGVGGLFFMRAELQTSPRGESLLKERMGEWARGCDAQWRLTAASAVHRLGVLVSKTDHCLQELLWQTQRGDIGGEIAVVVGNHAELQEVAQRFGLPFYFVDVKRDTKAEAERQILEILAQYQVDTVVLARYMQILSPDFVSHYPERIINIHHSFLPAFVGANPYQKAYDRGVKLIGATAHYVTGELDAGPIIEQDVERVDHRHQLADYYRIGRLVERRVLARAVGWHVDDRVLVYGNRTVVFPI